MNNQPTRTLTKAVLTLSLMVSSVLISSAASAKSKCTPFKPLIKITSNGKAYTECRQEEKQQKLRTKLRGKSVLRDICVNAKCEYYFLAE